jgi:hypothetical protein
MPSRETLATVVIVVAAVGVLAGTYLGPALLDGSEEPSSTGGETSRIVRISGHVHLATGDPAAGDTIFFSDEDAGAVQSIAVTNDSGGFESPVGSGTTVDLQYYQAREVAQCCAEGSFPRDGSPDFYPLARVVPTTNTSTGTIELPTAYPLNVTVVDESGTPIENASVHVRYPETERGADGGISGTTNANGRLEMAGASVPGIEVHGDVRVRLEREREVLTARDVTVTEPESIRLTLQRAA